MSHKATIALKQLHLRIQTILETTDLGEATESVDRASDQVEYAIEILQGSTSTEEDE